MNVVANENFINCIPKYDNLVLIFLSPGSPGTNSDSPGFPVPGENQFSGNSSSLMNMYVTTPALKKPPLPIKSVMRGRCIFMIVAHQSLQPKNNFPDHVYPRLSAPCHKKNGKQEGGVCEKT